MPRWEAGFLCAGGILGMNDTIGKTAGWVLGIGLANVVAFMIGAGILGGSAIPQKLGEAGYYVSNHGRRTEVSATAWHYSSFHKSTLPIAAPPMMLAGLVLVWRQSLKQIKHRQGKDSN